MGILDTYDEEDAKKELAKIALPKADTKDSSKREIKKKNSSDIDELIEQFKSKYKNSERKNQLLRIEMSHLRKLAKLKADGISLSEFVNFAIAFTVNSEHYNKIIKFLKKE